MCTKDLVKKLDPEKLEAIAQDLTDSNKIQIIIKSLVDNPDKLQAFARRVKSGKSIIEDLPDKVENNRYCSLTPEQTALYQEVVNTTMKKIADEIPRMNRGMTVRGGM
ncbi:hypothetical protein TNCV_3091151 [Trichonephila clavipes]|uniref:Uncharacterized protein n=1 Tax=Trichonephila clavipes TaxID=2585209 RepID=A0A8X6W8G6_TRICX|nr:hypothetical protein TNCV_3091151 [Trichonephila clavipes]